jgi:exodeoxyribonuclease VII small subunit
MRQASGNLAEAVPVSSLSFEQAFTELEAAVQKLSEGGLTLDESLALFERGQLLAAHSSALLEAAELKLRQLTPQAEVPFELDV